MPRDETCRFCGRRLVPEDSDFPDTSDLICVKCLLDILRNNQRGKPRYSNPTMDNADQVATFDPGRLSSSVENMCSFDRNYVDRLKEELEFAEEERNVAFRNREDLETDLKSIRDELDRTAEIIEQKVRERTNELERRCYKAEELEKARAKSEKAALELVKTMKKRNRMWPSDARIEHIRRECAAMDDLLAAQGEVRKVDNDWMNDVPF